MLLELVDASEISFPCECLFISSAMYWDQARSCILESFHEVYQETRILPSESSFDRYRYLDGLCHLRYNRERCITVDHQRWSMAAFNNLFCWTPHIDIDPRDSVSLYYLRCLCEHRRILAKYLDDEWIFTRIMSECSSLELFGVHESICRIKFRKYHCIWGNSFHDLAIRTIAISIHRSESCYGSSWCEIRPESIHEPIYIQKLGKIQSFSLYEIYNTLSSISFFGFFSMSMIEYW